MEITKSSNNTAAGICWYKAVLIPKSSPAAPMVEWNWASKFLSNDSYLQYSPSPTALAPPLLSANTFFSPATAPTSGFMKDLAINKTASSLSMVLASENIVMDVLINCIALLIAIDLPSLTDVCCNLILGYFLTISGVSSVEPSVTKTKSNLSLG